MHDDARLRPVGLDADRPREHGRRVEALAQQRDVVEPVEQRQHERRLALDPLQRIAATPAALVATISASTGSASRARAGGRAVKLPSVTLLTDRPCAAIVAAVDSRATTVTSGWPERSSAPG